MCYESFFVYFDWCSSGTIFFTAPHHTALHHFGPKMAAPHPHRTGGSYTSGNLHHFHHRWLWQCCRSQLLHSHYKKNWLCSVQPEPFGLDFCLNTYGVITKDTKIRSSPLRGPVCIVLFLTINSWVGSFS